jgi:ATP-binding cassette subfamily B multidrug efflux pump
VALLNNAILPQFGTLIRWRAHRQVLRQSVGFFENDFAGRIANRIMQTPLSGGRGGVPDLRRDHLCAGLPGRRGVLLFGADPRLLLPLIAWFALYGWLLRWTILRIGPASQGQRRRALGHHGADRGQLHQHPRGEALRPSRPGDRLRQGGDRNTRQTFAREMRLFTIMDVALTC